MSRMTRNRQRSRIIKLRNILGTWIITKLIIMVWYDGDNVDSDFHRSSLHLNLRPNTIYEGLNPVV